MSSQILLSGGNKWYSYSGPIFGDVSAPATIQMNFISNTGLRDSYVKIQPYYALAASTASGSASIGAASTSSSASSAAGSAGIAD